MANATVGFGLQPLRMPSDGMSLCEDAPADASKSKDIGINDPISTVSDGNVEQSTAGIAIGMLGVAVAFRDAENIPVGAFLRVKYLDSAQAGTVTYIPATGAGGGIVYLVRANADQLLTAADAGQCFDLEYGTATSTTTGYSGALLDTDTGGTSGSVKMLRLAAKSAENDPTLASQLIEVVINEPETTGV